MADLRVAATIRFSGFQQPFVTYTTGTRGARTLPTQSAESVTPEQSDRSGQWAKPVKSNTSADSR